MAAKRRFNYRQAFRLALLSNLLLLVIGLLLLFTSTVRAQLPDLQAPRIELIGLGGSPTYYRLQINRRTDIIYIYCQFGAEPRVSQLRDTKAVQCR